MSSVMVCDGCNKREKGRRYSEPWWHSVASNEDADHGDFCSWACLARWATERAIDREGVQALTSDRPPGDDE